MKDMIMGFVNEGTKITISDNRIEMVISKDHTRPRRTVAS